MIKHAVSVLVIFAFLLFTPKTIFATNDFLTDVKVEYEVYDSGITRARYEITLENVLSELYAQSFTLSLANISPTNIKAFSDLTKLKVEEIKEDSKTSLKVDFLSAVVGKGKKRKFVIEYDESSFANRTGDVWEISIPRLSENNSFRTYSVLLLVPIELGNEAYVSPKPSNILKSEGKKIFVFDNENVKDSGINAGFGQFQAFSFSLNYHLENSLNKSVLISIAIPPDTSLQRIFYESIDPRPENIEVDGDGNWLAKYKLKPKQRLDVNVKGAVQIFAQAYAYMVPSLSQLENNKKSTKFWQAGDAKINEIAQGLKTPRDIYEYVVNTLTYDYKKIQPEAVRLGALGALENKDSAICMEYTDLFIALARAKNIPAREINGFAYTDNPEIQPLSLVADVLHAWPEYWDSQRQAWMAIDPTWGATTGGVDYFDKLDLRHFAFVIHGNDPLEPFAPGSYKLGENPQKDVFVSFGQLPEERFTNAQIVLENESTPSLFDNEIGVRVKNLSPFALYDIKPQVFFDEKDINSETIAVLPPFASHDIQIQIPFAFFGKNMPSEVKVVVQDEEIIVSSFKKTAFINSFVISGVSVAVLLILGFKFSKRKRNIFRHV